MASALSIPYYNVLSSASKCGENPLNVMKMLTPINLISYKTDCSNHDGAWNGVFFPYAICAVFPQSPTAIDIPKPHAIVCPLSNLY